MQLESRTEDQINPRNDVEFLGDVDMFDDSPPESFPEFIAIHGEWHTLRSKHEPTAFLIAMTLTVSGALAFLFTL